MAQVSSNTNAASLLSFSDSIATTVEAIAASTTAVRGRGRHALGCGVVWRPGILVTAAHVFGRVPAAAPAVTPRQTADLALIGADAPTDVAVFRLPDEELPAVESSASPTRPGNLAIIVGRTQDADVTASVTVVHRVSGTWQSWLGGRIDELIRLDCTLPDGLSGAPVADAAGKVFGFATSALSRTHAIVIPSRTISRVVDELLAKGHVSRAFLGIGVQPVPIPNVPALAPRASAGEPEGSHGLLVTSMLSTGPAAQAGLLIGDILVDVGEQHAGSLAQLREALAGNIGRSVPVSLIRGGAPARVDVTVGQWPSEARAG